MYKEIKEIYDKTNLAIFAAGISYMISIGTDKAAKITDDDIAAMKEEKWASLDFLKSVVIVARDVAKITVNNPAEIIQFCIIENVFDTTYYAREKKSIPDKRMREIAECAISYIFDNDLLDDFEEDRIELDEEEKEYFGVEYTDEEEW